MLNSILQMFGGDNTSHQNLNKTSDHLKLVNGVIILDLQSVLVYGTNGTQINRDGNSEYIKQFFKALDEISTDGLVKIYILSDGITVKNLNNLISLNQDISIKNMFEENINYFIFSDKSSKKNALTTILNNYSTSLKQSESSGNSLKKILYFARLETNNKKQEAENYKSFVSKNPTLSSVSDKFNPHMIDSTKNPISSGWYLPNMMHTIKSLKELIYYPFYVSPFSLHPDHYKSMMRHIDTSTELFEDIKTAPQFVTKLNDLLGSE